MNFAPGQDLHGQMVLRSVQLRELLRAHGYRNGDGVSGDGLRLVKRVAAEHGLRDWPYTRTPADYDALISAVTDTLNNATGA